MPGNRNQKKSNQKTMSAKNLWSITQRNQRLLAKQGQRQARQLRWARLMLLARSIHAQVQPQVDKQIAAHDRMMGVNWEHSNAYGQGRRYGQLTYCGGIHAPANVNDNGMGDNSPMWTNGIALKARQES